MPSAVLTHAFAAPSRERGRVLADAGAVQVVSVTDAGAVARVRGSASYLTSVHRLGRTAALGCSCAHAAGGACCKHLWAFLLVLEHTPEALPLLAALAGATTVRLEALDGPDPDGSDASRPGPDRTGSDRTGLDRTGSDRTGPDDPAADAPPGLPAWQVMLERAASLMRHDAGHPLDPGARRAARPEWPADRRLVYVLDGNDPASRHLRLEILTERQARDGSWGPPRRAALPADLWAHIPDPRDRAIRRLLLGAAPPPDYGHARTVFPLADPALADLLPLVCATGRARLRPVGETPGAPDAVATPLLPVAWDDQAGTAESTLVPWRVALRIEPLAAPTGDAGGWVLTGALVRGEEQRPFTDVRWMHEVGLALLGPGLAPVEIGPLWPLVAPLLHARALPLGDDLAPVLERLYALPQVPPLQLPAGLELRESPAPPVPGIRFGPDPEPWARRYGGPVLGVALRFRYGHAVVDAAAPGATCFDAVTRTIHHRDRDAERAARDRLVAFGGAPAREAIARGVPFVLARTQLRRTCTQLTDEGWWIETDGRALHLPGAVHARVRSGTDWYDLEGTVAYGDWQVALADVLDARRRGAEVVTLADGSIGLLPDEWLDRLGPVLAGGERTPRGARFRSSQVALLDALLATVPDVDVDAAFEQARDALRAFDRITPADPSPSFTGTLRPYQRDGLGWLHFLRTFGFGGCLADDMGLGKTIQVLALLDARRAEGHGPSLVVVPRSLVFNWQAEAARFAPALRVADWSSAARRDGAVDAAATDVALVTYGTLRRDAAALADIPFDYVVLDEAQAIKNRGTATAKACRLLRASHRLALSGTPIENRLDELWSLLDFLNPGLLGPSSRFAASLREVNDERVVDAVLSRALRPVILRRTKAAVAPELPERIERTLAVELEPKQRAYYDQLHRTVRAEVRQQVDARGLARAKLHILEGLLRLRQAACHPALADPAKRALPSAKLDALLPALADVAAEGNKALVFSQFTGFLALVRTALEAEGIAYEYLDGRTKDRAARVARFQDDPACPVFLISLKAGGHGLNLTAADYVYLLDPWWNPAVEAQAIDRAHRIGRTRRVIATRLVARGTVEEKILALQASKRALADAILAADRGGLAAIGHEELELLLG
jgi:superfamily II DNA or RNA helicase